jgi:phage baseplate assembly protein W
MKKLLFTFAALALISGTFAQGKKASDVAKFETEVIDLGKIKQGTPTTAKFIVNNIAGEPLMIEQANPTCGCTISDYTKTPIEAGKTGEINATYNAANAGSFEKRLTVKFAGVDEVKSITIKGQVLTAEEYAKMNGETVPATMGTTAETKPAVEPVKADPALKPVTTAKKPAAKAKATAGKPTAKSKPAASKS